MSWNGYSEENKMKGESESSVRCAIWDFEKWTGHTTKI